MGALGDHRYDPCRADINGDGVVDTADLGILIGSFGTLCR